MANIKVSEVVASYLDEQNLGKAEYAKCYAIAIRGWRELNWDIVGTNKQVKLDVGSDNRALLPDDFISETKVGIDNGHGGIEALTRSNNINTVSKYKPEDDFSDDNLVGRGGCFGDNNCLPYECSLGVGSYPNIGYFKIDRECNMLVLSPTYNRGDVILEYLSYTTVDCEYTLNELAAPALLAWIYWRFSKTGTRSGLGTINDLRREYYNEKTKAKLRIKKMMIQDLNQLARKSVKQGIKS